MRHLVGDADAWVKRGSRHRDKGADMNLPSPQPPRHPRVRGLVAHVGVAAVPRYPMHECGDVVRVVDRPDGGISAIIADGQGHGRSARAIAAMAVGRIAALVAEGAREDAALVAANDLLLAHRGGQVSCEASIIAVDPSDGMIRVTRFARAQSTFVGDSGSALVGVEAPPLGLYRGAVPAVDTVEASASLACLVASDGVRSAGTQSGTTLNIVVELERAVAGGGAEVARVILEAAIRADGGRPKDDMSVACITFAPAKHTPSLQTVMAHWPLD
jgi:serine phosphatase RsbU (regulator of sigma subunit)